MKPTKLGSGHQQQPPKPPESHVATSRMAREEQTTSRRTWEG